MVFTLKKYAMIYRICLEKIYIYLRLYFTQYGFLWLVNIWNIKNPNDWNKDFKWLQNIDELKTTYSIWAILRSEHITIPRFSLCFYNSAYSLQSLFYDAQILFFKVVHQDFTEHLAKNVKFQHALFHVVTLWMDRVCAQLHILTLFALKVNVLSKFYFKNYRYKISIQDWYHFIQSFCSHNLILYVTIKRS